MAEQDQRLTATIGREQGRLRNFIRMRVADEADAEEILQDVFYELIEGGKCYDPGGRSDAVFPSQQSRRNP
jgi:DNA-directed RNA polymerase specialized sigma24 family protein